MKKTFLVMRQEMINTFKRPSYMIFAFVIPVLVVLVLGIVKLIQGRSTENIGNGSSAQVAHEIETEGFVDQSGIVKIISDDLQDKLIPFETEDQAKTALSNGDISAYYLIPSNYIVSGDVEYVYPDSKSYLSDGQQWVIKWILNLNLLNGDLDLADQIWNPIWHLETRSITPESQGVDSSQEDCSRPGVACESIELIRLMPSIMAAIFFLAFMSCSSMLFDSIGSEKENRTIELLLLSINPRQLLAGKTLALGIAGLTQTIIWLGAIYINFNLGGSTISLPEGFIFPVEIAVWSLLFFIGGFAIYASLMAGAGALVPKMKEAGAASFIAQSPIFIGYVFGLLAPLADTAESGFIVFLSIFPFTSPVVMVMRLTNSIVPLWQLLLSIILTYATAYFSQVTVAAMFNAQNLLSGQPFSVKRYLGALTGRI